MIFPKDAPQREIFSSCTLVAVYRWGNRFHLIGKRPEIQSLTFLLFLLVDPER